MDVINLFFDYRGRIGRRQFWIVIGFWLGVVIGIFILLALLSLLFGFSLPPIAGYVLSAVVYIPSVVSTVAAGLKRLRDRNKPIWWLLVFYLGPLIGFAAPALAEDGYLVTALSALSTLVAIWAFVELGCLRGTIGTNPHGADPVAPKPAKH